MWPFYFLFYRVLFEARKSASVSLSECGMIQKMRDLLHFTWWIMCDVGSMRDENHDLVRKFDYIHYRLSIMSL